MAKKPQSESSAAPAPTFDDIAHERIADALTTYRLAVGRAACGEALDKAELESVLDALAVLRLPESAWAADVAAMREHGKHEAIRVTEEAAQERYAAEAKRLAAHVEQMEKTLAAKKAELYSLNRRPMRLVACMQAQEDLRRNRPHVFHDADVVVGRIIAARPAPALSSPVR
jgi:hypothetical protein